MIRHGRIKIYGVLEDTEHGGYYFHTNEEFKAKYLFINAILYNNFFNKCFLERTGLEINENNISLIENWKINVEIDNEKDNSQTTFVFTVNTKENVYTDIYFSEYIVSIERDATEEDIKRYNVDCSRLINKLERNDNNLNKEYLDWFSFGYIVI